MFKFETTDDGLAITLNDEIVARVESAKTDALWNEKERKMVYQRTTLARDKWRIHFAGRLFTEAEIAALSKELAAQQG
jgi:hypothetical protein